jgi:cell division FtsZ-interacting protein ZapD
MTSKRKGALDLDGFKFNPKKKRMESVAQVIDTLQPLKQTERRKTVLLANGKRRSSFRGKRTSLTGFSRIYTHLNININIRNATS